MPNRLIAKPRLGRRKLRFKVVIRPHDVPDHIDNKFGQRGVAAPFIGRQKPAGLFQLAAMLDRARRHFIGQGLQALSDHAGLQ